jgi:hypothetical protein
MIGPGELTTKFGYYGQDGKIEACVFLGGNYIQGHGIPGWKILSIHDLDLCVLYANTKPECQSP